MAVTITLVSPANGETDVDQTPTLIFNVAVTDPDAGSQNIEVWLDGAWNRTYIGLYEPGNHTAGFSAALSAQTAYDWKIRGRQANPIPPPVTEEVWSDERSFTTGGLAKPVNPSPADEATGVALNVELSWDDGGGGVAYDVYFGEPGSMTIRANSQAETTFDITNLSYGTEYNWRVDAYDDSTPPESVEGDTWSFTCLPFDPPQVSYVLITGGSGAGPYDDPPGIEGTDWSWTGENNILTVRRLIAAANDKIWYEDI